jgi:hypothetical protein
MRVVALFLAMLAASTMVSSAQCLVRCSEPPSHPPCHRQTPSKHPPAAQPACDSLMVAGEALSLRLAVSPLTPGPTAGVPKPVAPPLPAAPSMIAAERWDAPPHSPLAAGLLVLRI